MPLTVSMMLAAAAVTASVCWWLWRQWARRLDRTSKVVVITGAGSGLGLSVTRRLLEAGDTVVACDVNTASLRQLLPEGEGTGASNGRAGHGDCAQRLANGLLGGKTAAGTLLPVTMDVTKEADVTRCIESLQKEHGLSHVDCVINFAGVMSAGPWCELEEADFWKVLSVNMGGTWRINKHFLPMLMKSTWRPRIVNVSSEVGSCRIATTFNGPYCASKWAVEAYTYSLRQELAALHPPVDVVALTPGAFLTAMTCEHVTGMFHKYADKPGSLHSSWLRAAGRAAVTYVEAHGKKPAILAEACYEAAHRLSPPARLSVNVSLELRLAGLIPRFLFDYAIMWTKP